MKRLLKIAAFAAALSPAIFWNPVTHQFNSVQAADTGVARMTIGR